MDLKDYKLGIVGGGVVGGATARAFVEHVGAVRIYDVSPVRRTHTLADVLECDVVMVCLPTPQKQAVPNSDGGMACNTTWVDGFFESVQGCEHNLVLRSTVPVGYTTQAASKYRLPNLVHSPEFLTARCADVNAQCPARNIIGITDVDIDHLDSKGVARALWCLYRLRWPHVPCLVMQSDESEAVKLGTNSFFAVKVAFFNELRSFCDAAGCDWRTVIDAILSDGRIHHSHTQVPGPDGKFGFSGACLPKDLASFIHQADALSRDKPGRGLFPWVSMGAHQRNAVDRDRTGGDRG